MDVKIWASASKRDKFIEFSISHLFIPCRHTQCPHAVQIATLYALSPNSFAPCQFVWQTLLYLAFITHLFTIQSAAAAQQPQQKAWWVWSQAHRRKEISRFLLLLRWHISKVAQMVCAMPRISIKVLRSVHENEEATRFTWTWKNCYVFRERARSAYDFVRVPHLIWQIGSIILVVFFSFLLFINATERLFNTPGR